MINEAKYKNELKKGLKSFYKYLDFDKIVQNGMTGAGRADMNITGSADGGDGVDLHLETKIKTQKPRPNQLMRMQIKCSCGGTAVWSRLEKDGMSHWYDLRGVEIAVTPIGGCEGILEICAKHVSENRSALREYKIPLKEYA